MMAHVGELDGILTPDVIWTLGNEQSFLLGFQIKNCYFVYILILLYIFQFDRQTCTHMCIHTHTES